MVQTCQGEKLNANHIIIASGSKPGHIPIPGIEHCMNSDDIFSLEELPKSLTVLGGGYIAVEMAQIMQSLGVKTTLVARNKLLTGVDQELIEPLVESMTKYGLDVRRSTPFTSISKQANGLMRVNFKNGEFVESEKVLSALGRPANTESMLLENAGVETNKSGQIIVDDYLNTNVPGIYALGDVAQGCPALTPVAVRSGRILSERLFNNKPHLKPNYNNIATVIFSHPPIGSVGLTEEGATAIHGAENIKVYRSKFINMFYSPAASDSKKHHSLFKLICLKQSNGDEKVIGCHIIGRNADEMMQGVSVAMTMGATKQDFDNSVAIHPTGSEELVLMDANFIS